MKRLPIYGDRTICLAFEFALVLAEVAKEKNIPMSKELSERAEKVFINEVRTNGIEKTACQFVPLILSCFEL